MHRILLSAALALASIGLSSGSASACGGPGCWLHEGKSYLLAMCKQHIRKPLEAKYHEEPETWFPEFVQACKKHGITVKVAWDQLCPDPKARCKVRDNPDFYKQ